MQKIKYFLTVYYSFLVATVTCAQTISEDDYNQIQSRTIKTAVLSPILKDALREFSESQYLALKPLIFEKNIPEIQKTIQKGDITYQQLVQFYLYRIAIIETDANTSLHSIIALNPLIMEEAKEKDLQLKNKTSKHEIFGMPILLKDNIGSSSMNTTAGALALSNNQTDDAFIVKKLKESGALILGKVNLSEWANYLSDRSPSGYSAVGGHTLNPYGPGKFDTGGSSSGSAVAVAANFAVASIGTETCGSILSPASQNSVVGLKPTVGLLSRTGIIPLSSTYDTPGPITKSIIDNAIVLSAMLGYDSSDLASIKTVKPEKYKEDLMNASLKGKRFAIIEEFVNIPLYKRAIEKIKNKGAILVEINLKGNVISGNDQIAVLNYDFKHDLVDYLKFNASKNVPIVSIESLISFNKGDGSIRIPYGQKMLENILLDNSSSEKIKEIKDRLTLNSRSFLENIFKTKQVDAILSVNNYNAFEVAMANYPALSVQMGYKPDGEPMALTFIGKPFQEEQLLIYGSAFEKIEQVRMVPKDYN
jgi:amidase